MPAPRKYPQELRERAVRLVLEAREQDEGLSLNAAVLRIGPRVGVVADTLRGWCRQAEIDVGRRPGVSTSEVLYGRSDRVLARGEGAHLAAMAEAAELRRAPRGRNVWPRGGLREG